VRLKLQLKERTRSGHVMPCRAALDGHAGGAVQRAAKHGAKRSVAQHNLAINHHAAGLEAQVALRYPLLDGLAQRNVRRQGAVGQFVVGLRARVVRFEPPFDGLAFVREPVGRHHRVAQQVQRHGAAQVRRLGHVLCFFVALFDGRRRERKGNGRTLGRFVSRD
jgi:hypothetical protein